VPVYLAGVNPYMVRLAGEQCDGFMLHSLNTRRYLTETVLPELEEGARRAGRPLGSIEICVKPFVVTGRNADEWAHWTAVVKRQIAYYASTRTYTRVLELHGWADASARLHEMTVTDRWDEIGSVITDEMLEAFAVVGAPEEIPGKLRARYDGLVQRIGLYHPALPVDRRALLDAFADPTPAGR
jgi:probable F420-dependent oxidoreductase